MVEPWGTDNSIWRVGGDLVVRLPRIAWAERQVAFEAEWLPILSTHVPVAVPLPVAVGEPGRGYPFAWAVHRWLPGNGAGPTTITDYNRFALDVAGVVSQLRQAPTAGAPAAKNRARPLAAYDTATRKMIDAAINQACGALPYYVNTYPLIVERSWHKLAVLGVHARDG